MNQHRHIGTYIAPGTYGDVVKHQKAIASCIFLDTDDAECFYNLMQTYYKLGFIFFHQAIFLHNKKVQILVWTR